MITRHEIEQRSPDWFSLRLGRITASNFGTVMGKPGVTRTKYLRKLAGEAVTGIRQGSFTTPAMQRGVDNEPDACAWYEFANDCTVQDGAFYTRDDLPLCGCSPDGIVGSGVVEFKVPEMVTHIGYLDKPDQVPSTYRWQVVGHLLFTGSDWCDFMSYSPEGLRPVLVRVERAEVEDELTALTHKLMLAESELREIINAISVDENQ